MFEELELDGRGASPAAPARVGDLPVAARRATRWRCRRRHRAPAATHAAPPVDPLAARRARRSRDLSAARGAPTPAAYNELMEQVLRAPAERHRRLLEELVATVGEHNPDVDRDLLERAFDLRLRGARGTQAPERRGLHRPPGRRRPDPRRAATGHRRPSPRRSCTTSSRTPTSTIDQVRAEFGDEIAAPRRGRHQADADQVPEPRAGAGRELPQDDRRDGRRTSGSSSSSSPIACTTCGRSSTSASRSRSRRRGRRSRCTRRSLTGSASTRSSGSSRTSRSRRSIPRKYQEIAGDGRPAAGRPRGVRRRGRAASSSASSRRPGSRPRSPAGRSTSTPSTRRW